MEPSKPFQNGILIRDAQDTVSFRSPFSKCNTWERSRGGKQGAVGGTAVKTGSRERGIWGTARGGGGRCSAPCLAQKKFIQVPVPSG